MIQYCYKQNRFQQLRGFCYSAREGSISAAARRLRLSQPSVTQQIQALERELGVQLFERCQGGIHLTRDGQLLFEMSLSLVEQMESLDGRFHQIRAGERREAWIGLAASQSSLFWILPEALEPLKKEQIHLRIEPICSSSPLFERLRERELDFAMGAFNPIPEDMEFVPIRQSHLVLVVPSGEGEWKEAGGASLKEISQWPLILPPKNSRSRVQLESAFARAGLSVRATMEVAGWEVIKKMVLAGIGAGLVNDLWLGGQTGLRRIPLETFSIRQIYGLVYCKHRALSRAARWFTSNLHSLGGVAG